MLNKINDVEQCQKGSIYNYALNVRMYIFNQILSIILSHFNLLVPWIVQA